jgi:hypothetical protein
MKQSHPEVLSRAFATQSNLRQVSAISADGSIPGSSSESGEGRSPLFVSPARSITRKDGSESPLQIDVGVVADVVGHLEDAATGEREAG